MTVTNDEREMDEVLETNGEAETVASNGGEESFSLEEQLEAAKAEAMRNLDGWQRTQAEFANARKRFEKQRAETYISANVELVSKLLPLIDDFERALELLPEGSPKDPWVSGIELVHRKMLSVLEEMDVQPVPAVGEPFDPNHHEALSQEPSTEYESGTVVREIRRGYQLGDRVIRPALVNVAP